MKKQYAATALALLILTLTACGGGGGAAAPAMGRYVEEQRLCRRAYARCWPCARTQREPWICYVI